MKKLSLSIFLTAIKSIKNSIAKKFFRMVCILLVLVVVSLTVENCSDRNCPKHKMIEYSFSSFSVSQLEQSTLIWIMNQVQQAEDNPIEFRKDFGVNIGFETEKTVIANCEPVHPFNILFIQPAYADCVEDTYIPKENITSIQVYSDKDFYESYPAGTDIGDFFKIFGGNSRLTSFENFLKSPTIHYQAGLGLWFRCVLTATAIETGEYEFTFVIRLSDERILEQSIKTTLDNINFE